jgi:5-methylcytosine-specific restriction endonuclease McrA
MNDKPEIPYGYCHCGCGQKTKIAARTRGETVAGQPSRYLQGHNAGNPTCRKHGINDRYKNGACKLCAKDRKKSRAEHHILNKERDNARSREYNREHRENLRIKSKENYEKNKKHILEQRRIYRSKHREQYRKYTKDWNERNPGKSAEKARMHRLLHPEYYIEYRNKNRERINAGIREWYYKNKPRVRATQNARKRGIKSSPEINIHVEWCKKQSCVYCGKNPGEQHDHVIPRGPKYKGPHSIENIVPCCQKCNDNKGEKPPEIWVDRWYYHV